MAVYEYTCGTCGPFDARHPIGQAPEQAACAGCGAAAARRFSPPAVRRVSPGLRRALDAQEAGAHQPRVVRR
ncbi:FmdB family zinc ribbon protein [Nonomuraea sp. NPDC050790]|uniref:FmdB family zinc ribbon protein n=1 Tax=Nonomuraea sp. NPDC050790 TaxID=3364371 RepID=UPI0037A36151